MAYEDYVTDSDLSNSLAQTIANKVSSSALKNFALNDGPDITKGDLANALQTEINNKLTGSATTSGNKLANVIINGQTLIAGGYIQSDLLYVDEIYANKGTIGAFSIGDYRLTNTDGHAGIDINYSVNQYARLNESAGATMVSARNDKGQAASFQAYGSGSTALYVIGNTGSMAIKGSGPISIYQRDGETWNMPGLLAIYYFTGLDGVPYMSYRWGNGASITSIRKTETGTYVFTTATGGSAVYPVVVNVASDQPVHFYIKDMSASGFTVKSYSLADNEFSARNALYPAIIII